MSRSGSLEADFGDGSYVFRLPWGEIERLQESCDAGPYVILERLMNNTWRLKDIRETIRFGLIGGNKTLPNMKVLSLIREYVEERPPMENVMLAQAILASALVGSPDEKPLGKGKAAKRRRKSTTSQTGSSDLPQSMVTEPS